MDAPKYEGLLRSYCRSRKGSRQIHSLRETERRSSYYIDESVGQMRNDSFLSEKASPVTNYDWRRNYTTNASSSLVEFNTTTKEPVTVLCLKGAKRVDQLAPNRPSADQPAKCKRSRTRNDSLKGSFAADIRRTKQINELRNRIVNLPNHSSENNRCITQVIQRITSHTDSESPRIKRSLNFRLKLKRPEVMKELLKIKVLQFSLSPEKIPIDHNPIKDNLYQTVTNLSPTNPERLKSRHEFKRRHTMRNRIERAQAGASQSPYAEPHSHYTEQFEIEPWNIEM